MAEESLIEGVDPGGESGIQGVDEGVGFLDVLALEAKPFLMDPKPQETSCLLEKQGAEWVTNGQKTAGSPERQCDSQALWIEDMLIRVNDDRRTIRTIFKDLDSGHVFRLTKQCGESRTPCRDAGFVATDGIVG